MLVCLPRSPEYAGPFTGLWKQPRRPLLAPGCCPWRFPPGAAWFVDPRPLQTSAPPGGLASCCLLWARSPGHTLSRPALGQCHLSSALGSLSEPPPCQGGRAAGARETEARAFAPAPHGCLTLALPRERRGSPGGPRGQGLRNGLSPGQSPCVRSAPFGRVLMGTLYKGGPWEEWKPSVAYRALYRASVCISPSEEGNGG